MYSHLKLEVIGDDRAELFRRLGLKTYNRPWVARCTWDHERRRINRVFLQALWDYRHANRIGSRGVYMHFTLAPGMYDVLQRVAWRRSDRYFLLALEDGTHRRQTKEEAEKWMQDDSLDVPY